jgi:L-histidine N-alpha-methyltransferase
MAINHPWSASSATQIITHDTEFARDVYNGLRSAQKVIPAKYLYDAVGSALFEAITLLPEYGLTRAEYRLLGSCAKEIAWNLAPISVVAELGSGSGQKTQRILETLASVQEDVTYFAIDVSSRSLQDCCHHLSSVRGVQCHALQSSYLEGLAKVRLRRPDSGSLLLLFLGSSIGNFSEEEIRVFLKRLRQNLRAGDAFLLGTDLVKPVHQLLEAYDDPAGVTAAFNLNLLSRINRELDADFRLGSFRHEARWCVDKNRIEMHLVSEERQSVSVPAANCHATFEAGESIWTEACQKFTPEGLEKIARETGFAPAGQWIDDDWPFAENLWLVA